MDREIFYAQTYGHVGRLVNKELGNTKKSGR